MYGGERAVLKRSTTGDCSSSCIKETYRKGSYKKKRIAKLRTKARSVQPINLALNLLDSSNEIRRLKSSKTLDMPTVFNIGFRIGKKWKKKSIYTLKHYSKVNFFGGLSMDSYFYLISNFIMHYLLMACKKWIVQSRW